ncbi:MAG: sialidase family protein [Bacillota bacterium]
MVARPGTAARRALAALLIAGLLLGVTGCTWLRRPPGFTQVRALGLDPRDPDRIYLATDGGLLVAGPGGRLEPAGAARLDLTALAIAPVEPWPLYASGRPGPGVDLPDPLGMVVSPDGGRTWTPVGLSGEVRLSHLAVSPIDPRLVYGWADPPGQLYHSEDGGATWTARTAAGVADGVAAGVIGAAMVASTATDIPGSPAGVSGTPTALPGAAAEEDNGPPAVALAPHPRARDQLLAATPGGLLWSPDRGQRWQTLLAGPVTAVAYSLQDPQVILAYHREEGLMESRNGGRTWTALGLRLPAPDGVAQIAIHPVAPAVVYLTTFRGEVLGSRDGGRTWKTVVRPGRR